MDNNKMPIPPFSEQEIRSFRHKAEKPMYVAMVIFNVLFVVIALVAVVMAFADEGPLTGETGSMINQVLFGLFHFFRGSCCLLCVFHLYLPITDSRKP